MAIEKSVSITNLEAIPVVISDRKKGRIKAVIDSLAVSSGGVGNADDVLLFAPIPSNAIILDLLVLNDGLDASGTPALEGNWGLYYSGIGGNQSLNGNVSGVSAHKFCFELGDTTLQSAVVSWSSKRFLTTDITSSIQEAWEIAGLSADCGGLFYIGFTVGAAAATDVAGDVVVRVDYI